MALSSGLGVARDSVCRTRDDAVREMEKAAKTNLQTNFGALACRAPWKAFSDPAGLEGQHSCLFFGGGPAEAPAVAWAEARDICHGLGADLITFQVGTRSLCLSHTLLSPPLVTALATPSCVLAEPL